MFDWFRKRWERRRANANLVGELYGCIANAARHEALYTRLGVADTLMGRYEMMALHTFLFQHRAKGADPALEAMAQDVVDAYFLELDHSLREVGIGDVSVPKRMRKLARMIYGRWEAYGNALREGDETALTEAFKRNVYAEGGDASQAVRLTKYALLANEELSRQSDMDMLAGRLSYPSPNSLFEDA